MTRLYFARHGHSEANVAGVFANRGDGFPLTAQGFGQARMLAERLSGVPVDRIYTSPLLRAWQTADAVSAVTCAPVEVTGALAECDMGELEGRSDAAGWAVHAEVNDDWVLKGRWDSHPPGGESLHDVQARFTPLIDALRAEDGDGSYILIGHGSLFRSVLPLVLANVDYSFTAQNGLDHTHLVVAEQTGASFVCRQWADRPVAPGEFLHHWE